MGQNSDNPYVAPRSPYDQTSPRRRVALVVGIGFVGLFSGGVLLIHGIMSALLSGTVTSLLLLALLVLQTLDRRAHRRFEDNWPRIDDDEFVRSCSPGTRRKTALRVRRIISHQLGIQYERIHPDQRFVEDLWAD